MPIWFRPKGATPTTITNDPQNFSGQVCIDKDFSSQETMLELKDNGTTRFDFLNNFDPTGEIAMRIYNSAGTAIGVLDVLSNSSIFAISSSNSFALLLQSASGTDNTVRAPGGGNVVLDSASGQVKFNRGKITVVSETLAISSGAITPTRSFVSVDPETGSADTLSTISGGAEGEIVYLQGTSGNTITVDENGNILVEGTSITLNANDTISLRYDGTNWVQIGSLVDHT